MKKSYVPYLLFFALAGYLLVTDNFTHITVLSTFICSLVLLWETFKIVEMRKSWQWDFDFPIMLLATHTLIFYIVVWLDGQGFIDVHYFSPTVFSFWSTMLRLHSVSTMMGLVYFRERIQNAKRETQNDNS